MKRYHFSTAPFEDLDNHFFIDTTSYREAMYLAKKLFPEENNIKYFGTIAETTTNSDEH